MMVEAVADIGEFGLIGRIRALLDKEGVKTPGVTLGMGDDAASFLPRERCEVLVTCDTLVEGRHFITHYLTPFDVGRRAMASNISDIGAMGGRPLYALVSLGLRSDTPVAYVMAMYQGFLAELNPLGASIIGGNLTKSGNGIFIDITFIGEVEEGKKVLRSTARLGDIILVTGYPGESSAGRDLLVQRQSKIEFNEHPLLKAYCSPSHRAREGAAVAKTGWATAMIDTSDGFVGDLKHLCEASGLGAQLSLESLPLSDTLRGAAQALKKEPHEYFLGDSDDYELIITCPQDHVNGIKQAIASSFSGPVTEVGRMVEAQKHIRLVMPDGSEREVTAAGWDHFR